MEINAFCFVCTLTDDAIEFHSDSLGAKVLKGDKRIEVEGGVHIDVNLAVENLSFSAHADAKGIMQLIRQCDAKNVVLVHGEKKKMGFLAGQCENEINLLTR